jgi:thiol-disulfide isomerase/thioredoxin
MRKSPLGIAIVVLVLTGLGAVLYVVMSATGTQEDGLERFARGELERLTVLADPPAQSTATFTDAEGAEVSLADFRGKVVVLNLWATYCGPCKIEMPSLDRLAGARDAGRVAVVPVSLDFERADAEDFYAVEEFADLGFYFGGVTDGFEIARDLGNQRLPITVIYDTRGRELARLVGGAEWDGPDAAALIDAVVEREFPPAAGS